MLVLQLDGDESETVALHEAVQGGQHEMGLEGEGQTDADVDASQSITIFKMNTKQICGRYTL